MSKFAIASLFVLAVMAPARADDRLVTIENFTFKPAAITVPLGTTVTFKNADDIPHSIVTEDGAIHSKALDTNDTTTVTFTKAGRIVYHCGLHPHMQGSVTVMP